MSADCSASQPPRESIDRRVKSVARRTRPGPVGTDASSKVRTSGSYIRVAPGTTSTPRVAKIQGSLRTQVFGDGHLTASGKRCELRLTLEAVPPRGRAGRLKANDAHGSTTLGAQRCQRLFHSLSKVLFIFRSHYLFAIGLGTIFSLRRNSPAI